MIDNTRLAALEAVAEAARVQHEAYGACHELIVALRAMTDKARLAALEAVAAGEAHAALAIYREAAR